MSELTVAPAEAEEVSKLEEINKYIMYPKKITATIRIIKGIIASEPSLTGGTITVRI
jgi:hypothetical protein